MYNAFSYKFTLNRNDRENPPPEVQEMRKNDRRVDQTQDRQYMIGEVSKLPSSKGFTFVEDPKNPNGFEVFYVGNSYPVARISWSSVLPLMEFPTIDVHSVENGERFILALDDPKAVNAFLSKIADKQKDADFVSKNLSEIAKDKGFRFMKDPKNPNSIDVFIQGYRTRLASFSWSPSPLGVLLDFPTIDVTSVAGQKYVAILESKDQISKYLDDLKKQAQILGIVPGAI